MLCVSKELKFDKFNLKNRNNMKAIMTKLIIFTMMALASGCMPFSSNYTFKRTDKTKLVQKSTDQNKKKLSIINLFRQAQPTNGTLSNIRDKAKIAKVGDKMDVCGIGHTSVEELERQFAKFKKSPLKGKGEFFLQMEQKYGINARFIAAIATVESGCGTHCANKNNFFGVKGGKRGYKAFNTVEEGIESEFSMIKRVYIDKNRKTVASIGRIYCENKRWPSMINGVMKKI